MEQNTATNYCDTVEQPARKQHKNDLKPFAEKENYSMILCMYISKIEFFSFSQPRVCSIKTRRRDKWHLRTRSTIAFSTDWQLGQMSENFSFFLIKAAFVAFQSRGFRVRTFPNWSHMSFQWAVWCLCTPSEGILRILNTKIFWIVSGIPRASGAWLPQEVARLFGTCLFILFTNPQPPPPRPPSSLPSPDAYPLVNTHYSSEDDLRPLETK